MTDESNDQYQRMVESLKSINRKNCELHSELEKARESIREHCETIDILNVEFDEFIAAALPIARAYAAKNPKWFSMAEGREQDPCGVHAFIKRCEEAT